MALFYNPKSLSPEARIAHVKQVLAAYADHHAVDFVFCDSPKTNGKTVWLGNLDATSDTFLATALAHGMHEMLHVTETAMTVFNDHALSPLEKTLLNVLEDVRIDAIGMRRYPGYAAWRADLAERLEVTGKLKAARPPQTLAAATLFCTWLHAELMAVLNVAWARHYAPRLRLELLKQLEAPRLTQILQVAQKCIHARSTALVRTLAQRIVALLRAPTCQAGTGELFDTPKANAQYLQSLEETATPSDDKVEFDVAQACSQVACDTGPEDTLRVVPWPEAIENTRLKEDALEYGRLFAAQHTQLTHLTHAFAQLMQVAQPIERVAREGNTLAEDYIERLATNDDRLFLKNAIQNEAAADIVILLDRSGSMGLERMTMAKVALAALVSSLKPLRKVKTTVAVFPGPFREHLALLKNRSDSTERFLNHLSGVGAFGATPLVQALTWALKTLESSRDVLKLVVLITDGAYPANRVQETRSAFEHAHVELAVMNIDTENAPLSTNCVNVVASDEIAPGLLTLMRKTTFARTLRNV